jgi:hypothetical protein
MEHAQHVNPSFFGTSLGDQLIGADYHGTPLKVIGWDSLEKWLDVRAVRSILRRPKDGYGGYYMPHEEI